MLDLATLNFEKGNGLVTVVTQDARTGAVLMVAHADREALEKTMSTCQMHYRSRSRGLWHKGATSKNVQHLISLDADCDGDAILARVIPAGPACHTGTQSCFGNRALESDALGHLNATLSVRAASLDPSKTSGYSQKLLADRNLRLKKIGEESAELVTACADGDAPRATEEAADVIYHALVALRSLGVGLEQVQSILWDRSKPETGV